MPLESESNSPAAALASAVLTPESNPVCGRPEVEDSSAEPGADELGHETFPAPVPLSPDAGETPAEPSPAEPPGPAEPALSELAPEPAPVLRPSIPTPPVQDVHDLDWDAIHVEADPAAMRARMQKIVAGMEALLDRAGGQNLAFDADRAGPDDRAIHITTAMTAEPVWFVGDLHGDILALEAALALIRREAGEGLPRIVFLGDLFDDEGFGLEVLLRIFALIVDAPEQICVLAGNHDEALSYDGARFAATVSPSDFSDALNANLADEWIARAGKLTVRFFANAPRALFFPDGLLAAHGGFPLADLHARLAETGNWNDPACLQDFVWTRAHPTARRKLPNRFSRGSQFGYQDFAAFCDLATRLGRPVTHFVRGHDHVEERWAVYPKYEPNPMLTTVALSRRLPRESYGPPARVPTVARMIERCLPQVYRLHIPADLILVTYPEAHGASGPEVLP